MCWKLFFIFATLFSKQSLSIQYFVVRRSIVKHISLVLWCFPSNHVYSYSSNLSWNTWPPFASRTGPETRRDTPGPDKTSAKHNGPRGRTGLLMAAPGRPLLLSRVKCLSQPPLNRRWCRLEAWQASVLWAPILSLASGSDGKIMSELSNIAKESALRRSKTGSRFICKWVFVIFTTCVILQLLWPKY